MLINIFFILYKTSLNLDLHFPQNISRPAFRKFRNLPKILDTTLEKATTKFSETNQWKKRHNYPI